MKGLDILFVHPNASGEIYQSLSLEHSAIETPIWAAMLANSARNKGFSVGILDAEAERLTASEAARRISETNARIACLVVYGQQPSASSQNMEGAVRTSSALKEISPDVKVLFVGPHVSALPDETLRREKSIDFVCMNEGVYTIHQICEVQDLTDVSALSRVQGLVYRDDKKILHSEPSTIVPRERLHIDLPGPAWDLLPSFDKYRTAGWHSWSNNSEKQPFASLYTSLGCPYKCSFCMINIINRTKKGPDVSSQDSSVFRWWDPEFIIQQFDTLAKEGVKNVKIADELFVLNVNHFMKICDLIIERGYDFNIWAYSRVDTCKPEYLERLRKAGVKWLALGIENPNTVLRKEVHKGGFKDVRITDIVSEIRSHDMSVMSNYIFGLPVDTHESMKETYQYAVENMTEAVNFYSAMAYPGSPLYNRSLKSEWEIPSSYSGYSQHSYDTLNLRNENLTAAEILAFRDNAWKDFHTNLSYLNLIEMKFGVKARENVERSAQITLKRKILGD